MSYLLEDPKSIVNSGGVSLADKGWSDPGEIFNATYDEMVEVEAEGINVNVGQAYQPVIDMMNARRKSYNQVKNPLLPYATAIRGFPVRSRASIDQIWEEINQARARDASAFADLPGSHDELVTQTKDRLANIVKRQRDLSQRGKGFAATAAELGGGVAGSLSNPLVLSSMFLGGPATGSFLRFVGIEAGIGAATEAALLPGVAATRAEIGVPLTFEEGALRVGFGAVGGAAVGGAVKGGGKVISGTLKAGKKVTGRFHKRPIERAADEYQNHIDEITEELPADMTPIDKQREVAKVHEAAQALVEERMPALENQHIRPKQIGPADRSGVDAIAATDIAVDAKLFQFKEGGDASGVTDRLHGVKQWDDVKSGLAIVYEFEDGRLFIADGHQRLGLAKRLMAEGHDPITIDARVLRQADGISPAEARLLAAAKNIAEGTGTAIDAAKVLRVDPAQLSNLPPRSTLVRDAQGLMNLTDDLFGMAVNEVVPAHFAAIVGRLAPDDQLVQEAAMKALADVKPANMTQAEALVRMVRENDVVTEVQEGLFGDELVATSLIKERSEILDHALKELRRDKSTFKNLVKQSDRIEDAGNQLDRAQNQQRAQTDDQAIGLLLKAATVKGGISDALTEAAQAYRQGGSRAASVRRFVEFVRRAIEAGDLDGSRIGGSGRRLETAETGGRLQDEELSLFDQPAGEGQAQQVAHLKEKIDVQRDRIVQRQRAGAKKRYLLNDGEDQLPIDDQIALAQERIDQLLQEMERVTDNQDIVREVRFADPERRAQAEAAQADAGLKPLMEDKPLLHVISSHAINKWRKDHLGNPEKEIARGNLPSSEEDLFLIPYIVTHATPVATGKSKRGLATLSYRAIDPDGVVHVVEEIQAGSNLTFKTAYRIPSERGGKVKLPDRPNEAVEVDILQLPPETLRPQRAGVTDTQPASAPGVKAEQDDLFAGVPLADEVIDGVQTVRTIDEIEAEAKADQDFIDGFEGCMK